MFVDKYHEKLVDLLERVHSSIYKMVLRIDHYSKDGGSVC